MTPHIAIDGHLSKTGKRRTTAIDARTTRHMGYDLSQRCRKRIEEVFGWIKSSAGLAKVKLRGRARVDGVFVLALATSSLIRLSYAIRDHRNHPDHFETYLIGRSDFGARWYYERKRWLD